MRLSRAERSLLTDWWFTVDRVLLTAVLALAGAGAILSLAAGPAAALKRGLPPLYFVERHLAFTALAVLVMLAVSILDPPRMRRLALVVLLISFALMAVILVAGPEINGARRWLRIAGHSLQPSEFAKPAFVLLSAWLLGESERRRDVPATSFALGLLLLFAGMLVLQPDIGQTLLIFLVWGTLFFLSGQPMLRAFALALVGAAGLVAAYFTFPHVHQRIGRFLAPGSGDTFQVDRALQSIVEGGFFGRGPGEGIVKTVLPDAHTDFILSVIAEEYGVLACLAVLGLFAFIALRALGRARAESDPFLRLATAGLALLIAFQALINMGVTVGLLPAKGMTLPLISMGGSSTLAIGLTLGLLIGVTRRRVDPERLKKPTFMPHPMLIQTPGRISESAPQ
ncbi:MAG: FtsW/RodA/SpoVE family cell cycle protein [Hyphomicrobiaceae bacterium]